MIFKTPFRRNSAGGFSLIPCLSPTDLEAPTLYEQKRRIRWAQLIRRVWLEDPLLYPDCGSEMQILSFITEPNHLLKAPGRDIGGEERFGSGTQTM